MAGEDPEAEVVTPSGKNVPSTSSAKKTPKRYQKRQKQDDLEDELLAFIQKESGGTMMSEVEHAFSAHTMRISKHLNADETEDLLEAVQQLVDSHIRQARLRKSMNLHGSTFTAPMAQYGTMQHQRALDMQMQMQMEGPMQSNNYRRPSTNQIPAGHTEMEGTMQSNNYWRASTNQIPASHTEMGPPASTVQNTCDTVQNFQGGGLTMLQELAPMEPPGRVVPFTRV